MNLDWQFLFQKTMHCDFLLFMNNLLVLVTTDTRQQPRNWHCYHLTLQLDLTANNAQSSKRTACCCSAGESARINIRCFLCYLQIATLKWHFCHILYSCSRSCTCESLLASAFESSSLPGGPVPQCSCELVHACCRTMCTWSAVPSDKSLMKSQKMLKRRQSSCQKFYRIVAQDQTKLWNVKTRTVASLWKQAYLVQPWLAPLWRACQCTWQSMGSAFLVSVPLLHFPLRWPWRVLGMLVAVQQLYLCIQPRHQMVYAHVLQTKWRTYCPSKCDAKGQAQKHACYSRIIIEHKRWAQKTYIWDDWDISGAYACAAVCPQKR